MVSAPRLQFLVSGNNQLSRINIGGATAAVGAGMVRTYTGSYLLAFLVSGLACLLASMLVLRIARTRPAMVMAGE